MVMRGDIERSPVIGMSSWTRLLRTATKERPTETVPRGYVDCVEAAGGLPVLLPNRVGTDVAEACLDLVDGLLLTGGDDVHPHLFGEAPHPRIDLVDERRDRFEIALIHAARRRGAPVLGVCRGVQVMNIALGGDIYQDIPSQFEGSIGHAQRTLGEGSWHEIDLQPGTRLAEICGAPRVPVNSHHHQACRRVGPGLVASATAVGDGMIEGLEDPRMPFFVGVQWHPEVLENGADPVSRRLFDAFVAAARDYRRAASKERPVSAPDR